MKKAVRRMNFSEFCESLSEPLYEKKGETKCKSGYTYNKKLGKCVPEVDGKNRAGENPGDKTLPGGYGSFNVWGATGLNGDGYALEEMKLTDYEDSKYQRRIAKHEAENKASDERMKYGKRGKEAYEKDTLRPGEVRKFNKETGKWESNKR